MEFGKSRADVAVFVDFENVYVSVREKFDAQPNFELIMDRCEDFGRIVIARAYADWYRYPRVTSALFANGVEPMYVPTYYYDREVGRTGRPIKNSVDIHLCIDAMRTLYTQTHIDKFVLVTGDRDFIPLVNAIRQHGKEVIIIGIGGAASAHLAQSSDEFLFYEQIADIKPPQQAREQAGRGERRERGERTETNGRADTRRERKESTPRSQLPVPEPTTDEPSGRPARTEVASALPDGPEATPEPALEAVPDAEAGTAEHTPYDTLVDAINLARQRGFVSNLGSLKVLMRELDSDFNESKVRDANGKAFGKFKDFVKEAERQGRVQIFTNGTVTEVFLPGEDPMRVSQFADELAEQQAEREIENELDREAERNADRRQPRRRGGREESRSAEFPVPVEPETVSDAGTPEAVFALDTGTPEAELVFGAGTPEAEFAPEGGIEPEPLVEAEPLQAEYVPAFSDEAAVETSADAPAPVFGEREWEIFRSSMAQFVEPVRFANIFSALRGLRNQEVLGLTNNELKELVKQAINRGMLQRTGRGARAYYRLTAQYRSVPGEPHAAEPVFDISSDTAAGLVDAGGRAADAEFEPPSESVFEPASELVFEPAGDAGLDDMQSFDQLLAVAPAPIDPALGPQAMLEDVVADQLALQTTETPAPKPRRNRRKKKTDEPAGEPAAEAASVQPGAETNGTEGPEQPVEAPKKRRTRRKPKAEES